MKKEPTFLIQRTIAIINLIWAMSGLFTKFLPAAASLLSGLVTANRTILTGQYQVMLIILKHPSLISIQALTPLMICIIPLTMHTHSMNFVAATANLKYVQI